MIGTAKLIDAPGCIGSSMIRKSDHPICKACAFTATCAVMAVETTRRLARELELLEVVPVKTPPAKPKPKVLVSEPMMLSEKSKNLLDVWVQRGFNVQVLQETLREKKTDRLQKIEPGYSRFLLLELVDKPASKSDLVALLQRHYAWGKLTAQAHVSIFCNAASHAGVLKDDGRNVQLEVA